MYPPPRQDNHQNNWITILFGKCYGALNRNSCESIENNSTALCRRPVPIRAPFPQPSGGGLLDAEEKSVNICLGKSPAQRCLPGFPTRAPNTIFHAGKFFEWGVALPQPLQGYDSRGRD